jgi:hypothetical protein
MLGGCGSSSPPAAPVPSPAPLPVGWVRLTIDDPPLAMGFPPEWHAQSLEEARQQLQQVISGLTGDAARQMQAALDDLTSARVRFIAAGPAAMHQVQTSMSVTIDANDASLDAAADRLSNEVAAADPSSKLAERAERLIALGRAMRLHWTSSPTGNGLVPSQSFAYVVRLSDGRTMSLSITSVAEDSGLEALVDSIVATFSLTR